MPREISIPARTGLEEIQSIEHVRGAHVRVVLGVGSVKRLPVSIGSDETTDVFVFDDHQQFKQVMIAGADYCELISERPAWAPNKPAGEFRKDDLWHFVDLIRAR